MHPTALLFALLLDAALGEPKALWNRYPHPVVVVGGVIAWCDRRFNRGESRRLKGVAVIAALSAGAWLLGAAIAAIPDFGVLEVLAAAVLIAQRSLADHVQAVGNALRLSLADGKRAVAMIVGRDTGPMDEPAVARAAIESAAENLSDGVVAPAFWFLIGGLPGIMVYKVVNTADSIIGHRTPRHEEFGWAAARLDDLLNLISARLTAALIALAHGWFDAGPILRDAPKHRSPNAGWPESALAPVLDVALAGPRSYNGRMTDFPWVWPEGRREIGPDEVDAAVRALWRTWGAMVLLLAVWMIAAL
ncbi:MAG: adenosylcobinamide-phosphate synthase CbiB [Paracoccaceae bacterium]